MCSNPVFLSLPPSFPFISLPHICFHVVSLVLCYCCNCNQMDHKGDFTLSFSLKSVLIRFSLNFAEGCGVTQKEHRKFADAEIIERVLWKVVHLGKVTCARPRSSSCWTRLQPGTLECSAQSECPGRTSPGEPKKQVLHNEEETGPMREVPEARAWGHELFACASSPHPAKWSEVLSGSFGQSPPSASPRRSVSDLVRRHLCRILLEHNYVA